jgi:hypothetical protein
MNSNFRLRFDLVEGHYLNSADEQVGLDLAPSGDVLTLRSGIAGAPIASQPTAAIVGGPYPSEQLAQEAAERVRDTILVWAVRRRFGVDVGGGCVRGGILTDGGRAYFAKALGRPIRGDVQGIDVYPAEADTMFVRVGAQVGVGVGVDGFVAEFREIRAGAWQLSEKQRLAAELFSASFFDRVPRSRFITLVTVVEALLDAGRRSVDVQEFVDQARELAEALPKSEPSRQSLITGLERLRDESIGQAGRHLADRLLKDRSYDELPAAKFFTKCYGIRSQTVHRGVPEDPDIDFLTLGNSCQQFVGDLLLASFADAAQPAVAAVKPATGTSV